MRVLIAVDLKKGAELVLDGAKPWVERLQATADLVYVDEFRSAVYAPDPHVASLLQLEWDRMKAEDELALNTLLNRLPTALRGQVHLATGNAATTVSALADAYDAVIVSTHGRSGLSHFWLGSVAERIVRSCPKPVVVLRLGQTS